nr:PepSY domain-containing protein [Bacteriovorax sp. HI3]
MNLLNSLKRFHAFLGLFIGPFIFIAAFSGAIYAFTFAMENWVYRDILTVKKGLQAKSLADQVEAAEAKVHGESHLLSIRPAVNETSSTRVLYTDSTLPASQYRTLFIDPYTLEVKADLITYGSGGAMPARMQVDLFHRDLLLGKGGRWYSELAASWLWVAGLSGLVLFCTRKKREGNSYQRLVNKHVSLGLFSLIGVLMLSVTGLTWSELAGENISWLRTQMQWQTPSLDTKLDHRPFKAYEFTQFDKALLSARQAGIDSSRLEIKPPRKDNEGWQVNEIGRSFPSEVDGVLLDPDTMAAIDKVEFSKFPLMAKLTRWGIDVHMGTLFGFVNQMIVGLMSLGICALVVTGYWMWIKRRGWRFKNSLYSELRKLSLEQVLYVGCIALPVAFFFPLILISLLIFIPFEEIYFRLKRP